MQQRIAHTCNDLCCLMQQAAPKPTNTYMVRQLALLGQLSFLTAVLWPSHAVLLLAQAVNVAGKFPHPTHKPTSFTPGLTLLSRDCIHVALEVGNGLSAA